MPFVRSRNVPIYFETQGQGPPLLFLNGILMNTSSWAYQRKAFRKDYQCIFHDFRDQGKSGSSPSTYGMGSHVRDLLVLLDELGIEKAHLAGTSYGGEVGLLFTTRYPERVRSLTLIASVSHLEPLLRLQVELWDKINRSRPELLSETIAAMAYSDPFLRDHPGFLASRKRNLENRPADFQDRFSRLCGAFLQFDLRDRLHLIRTPVWIIAAGLDILKPPSYSRYLENAIFRAGLDIIPDAGHAVVVERPDRVNESVMGFLRKH